MAFDNVKQLRRAIIPGIAAAGPASPHMPYELYPHAFKPLAFAMTGALGVPAPSTPMMAITLADLMPARPG